VTSILLGLISALSWGSGDFFGGLSSRRIGPYLAVLYAEAGGLALLLVALPVVGEPMPPIGALWMPAAVGGVGCLALVLLYKAMIGGKMSIAAPISALLGVILPIVVGIFTDGLPGALKLMGFGFALAAIWLISKSDKPGRQSAAQLAELRLPFLAGLGFGLYFILMHFATQTATLWPLAAARTGGTLVILAYVLWQRMPLGVPPAVMPIVGVAGLLDVGGNLFYILAGQVGRMDVAAVLASLYPGATIFLAWLFLKERIGRAQALGIGAALAAIVLMTLS
jgi:drug/metabolite transporter (DMT)-like permease